MPSTLSVDDHRQMGLLVSARRALTGGGRDAIGGPDIGRALDSKVMAVLATHRWAEPAEPAEPTETARGAVP